MPCKMQTFLVMLFISSIVFKTVVSFTSTISNKLSKTSSHNKLVKAAYTKMSTSEPPNKIIALIRHGQTECNEYLHGHEWGCENFKDPEVNSNLHQFSHFLTFDFIVLFSYRY